MSNTSGQAFLFEEYNSILSLLSSQIQISYFCIIYQTSKSNSDIYNILIQLKNYGTTSFNYIVFS